MEFVSVSEIAKKWKVSDRMVRNYCTQGKIKGAFLTGKTWNIPSDAKKPVRGSSDKIKSALTISVISGLVASISSLIQEKKGKGKKITNVSAEDIKDFLNKKIKNSEEKISVKTKEVNKLMAEIQDSKKTIERYKYALENLDLEQMAKEINDK